MDTYLGHAQASTQHRDDRNSLRYLTTSELYTHRGSDRSRLSLDSTSGLVAEVECDLLQYLAEVVGGGALVAK